MSANASGTAIDICPVFASAAVTAFSAATASAIDTCTVFALTAVFV